MPTMNKALVQVLGAVAYGERKAYEDLRDRAEQTLDPDERRVLRTFAAQEFGADGKRVAKEMIEGIESAFERNLANVSWMDDTARAASRGKLRKIMRPVMLRARTPTAFDDARFNSALSGLRQSSGIWLITDDDRDFRIGNPAVPHGISKRHHVRAAPGD